MEREEGPPVYHCHSEDYRKTNRAPTASGMSKHNLCAVPLLSNQGKLSLSLSVSVSFPFIPLMKGKEKKDFPLENQETRGKH